MPQQRLLELLVGLERRNEAISLLEPMADREPDRWALRLMLAELRRDTSLVVGDNEPYSGHLPGDAIDRHALQPGRHNTLIELRQDLIATPAAQNTWAGRLVPLLQAALVDVDSAQPMSAQREIQHG